MNRHLRLLSFAAMSAMASCVATNKGFQSSPVVSREVQLDPIKADIKVNESNKLKGESFSTYVLSFKVNGDNTFADGIAYSTEGKPKRRMSRADEVRAAAAYKALSQGDYDFLVHPNYVMTKKNYLGIVKVYECSVTGYGANYTNFRTEKRKIVFVDGKEFEFSE
jgi:hypothetical protein